MTLVTSSEIGPPSIHSQQEMHSGLPVAATANPGRTDTFNLPKQQYPTEYGGMKIDKDPEYQHMLIAIKPDGSLFGRFMQAKDYKAAIDAYNLQQKSLEITHIRKSMYAKEDA